jgi:short-subunit dehydrogenase
LEKKQLKKFSGKVAIVTGSSKGIGKAIALELAKQGISVVLNGRNESKLRETEQELKKTHQQCISVCADVSTIEGSNLLIQSTINVFGRLDILINNVGISSRGNVTDLNPEVFKRVFESNILGTVYPTIPALKYIQENSGSIVFISSLAGIRGLPGLSPYCSSKMALRAIAESIRIETKNKIHVGLIYVGVTEIEPNKEAIAADGTPQILASRNTKKVKSTQSVAKAVLKNIKRRKFISILTPIGNINAFLQRFFPAVVEWIIIKNIQFFNVFFFH